MYEAFPIYEKELMEAADGENADDSAAAASDENESDTCGFSAILEKTEDLSGSYNVKILTGDKCYSGSSIEIR